MAAKDKKEKKDKSSSAITTMRERYAAGDIRTARVLAKDIATSSAAFEAERAEASSLLERSRVDRRAIYVGLAAILLAALVVIFVLLK